MGEGAAKVEARGKGGDDEIEMTNRKYKENGLGQAGGVGGESWRELEGHCVMYQTHGVSTLAGSVWPCTEFSWEPAPEVVCTEQT